MDIVSYNLHFGGKTGTGNPWQQMMMSSRLSARHEVAYSMDETDMVIQAFFRKKAEEGKGRKPS